MNLKSQHHFEETAKKKRKFPAEVHCFYRSFHTWIESTRNHIKKMRFGREIVHRIGNLSLWNRRLRMQAISYNGNKRCLCIVEHTHTCNIYHWKIFDCISDSGCIRTQFLCFSLSHSIAIHLLMVVNVNTCTRHVCVCTE